MIAAYDFRPFSVVMDVAGGQGALLAEILCRNPGQRGILFDQPQVVAKAGPVFDAAGVADRCDIVAGDFFISVPEGADAIVLKWILHDWDDDTNIRILKTCRRAMRPEGKLLVLESILAPPNEGAAAKFGDLNMLIMPGGQERTAEEFRLLLAASRSRILLKPGLASPSSRRNQSDRFPGLKPFQVLSTHGGFPYSAHWTAVAANGIAVVMMAPDSDGVQDLSALTRLRDTLRKLYHGRTPAAFRFQMAAIVVDLAIIAFFIATPVIQQSPSFLWLDYSVAALVAADMIARLLASNDMLRLMKQPTSWVDAFILLTLLMPTALANLGFLRILRLWSLSRSGALWRFFEMRGFKKWREASHAVINLLTFLLVVTGFVYTFFFRTGAGVEGYVDALYFTVATVTTTGFGDIVLPGISGKLTAIVTMIIGISLFVRLARALFRPAKVFFPCPQCGLQRHELDAVHCKACGHALKIPDDGD